MNFEDDGYLIIKNFWSEDELSSWEDTVHYFYEMQYLKCGFMKAIHFYKLSNLDGYLEHFEKNNQQAAYEVIKMLERSSGGKKIVNNTRLVSIISNILGCKFGKLVSIGPSPFINLPTSKRLLYKWHSESNYYPKRTNFINVWFPIFRDKKKENGTMWFCKGSHKIKERQFIEYQGYDKETHGKKKHFVQYEIPEFELKDYESVPVEVNRGDLVLFDRSLVHCSTVNQSLLPSYATVMRFFDYSKDLTLSGAPEVTPYNTGDYSVPDLQIVDHNL